MKANNFELVPIGKIEGDFTIPSYQRGYRWGKGEVEALLNDIWGSNEKPYCLQPIVVLRRDEGKFDLIDGQQRLTTLYLLYKYLEKTLKREQMARYTISYATRPDSQLYLQTIDGDKSEENIDFWHMHQAYKTIEEWFESKAHDLSVWKEDLAYKFAFWLSESVKVIWYEIMSDADRGNPEDLFTRLNIGKIPLTNSELVKALFLKESANPNSSRYDEESCGQIVSAEQISILWDRMETALRDNSFWYFLSSDDSYSTRIDLILSLIADADGWSGLGDYATFDYFEHKLQIDKVSITELWTTIQDCFLRLKGWYDDHSIYHKVGYLIASDTASLGELYALSKDKCKRVFEEKLDEMITESIKLENRPYSDLTYEKEGDKSLLSQILLLFNVESMRTIDANDTSGSWVVRFPFDKYKTNKWSLEHIHAQHSEGLNTNEKRLNWLQAHLAPVRVAIEEANLDDTEGDLIERANDLITRLSDNSGKAVGDDFDALHAEMVKLLSRGSKLSMNHIDNMTLLDVGNNAALSNYAFDAKRNIIIEKDKCGCFIPHCTKMVFFKYFSTADNVNLHYWGVNDRKAYIEAINEKLRPYLGGKTIDFQYTQNN